MTFDLAPARRHPRRRGTHRRPFRRDSVGRAQRLHVRTRVGDDREVHGVRGRPVLRHLSHLRAYFRSRPLHSRARPHHHHPQGAVADPHERVARNLTRHHHHVRPRGHGDVAKGSRARARWTSPSTTKGQQFAVTRVGTVLTITAEDRSVPGNVDGATVSLPSDPDVPAVSLSFTVGPAPSTFPKAATIARQCSAGVRELVHRHRDWRPRRGQSVAGNAA